MYLDVPERRYNTSGGKPHFHLEGFSQVHDLATFINGVGSLAYLVFRDVKCDDNMRWDFAQRSSPSAEESQLFWEESIAIVHEELRSAVDGIAKCVPNNAYFGDKPHQVRNHNQGQDFYEPRFFYHHRAALASSLASFTNPLLDQLKDLLKFINTTYGATWSKIDRLLSQGLVQRDHLEWLFCPNHLIISKKSGSLSAFVLRSWPSGRSALRLDCWGWGFDGQWLHRKSVTQAVARPLKTVVSIRDLEVFPLQYATEDEKKSLYARGRKFWGLRYKNIASYEGWDYMADHKYVGGLCNYVYK